MDINWDRRKRWKNGQKEMDDEKWRSIYNSEMLSEVPVNYGKDAERYRKPISNILRSMKEYGLLYPYFKGPRYADIGCGPGNLVNCVAMNHPKWICTGIDVSDEMIRYGSFVASKLELPNSSFVASSLESFDGGPFDTITMYETVEHLWDVHVGLKKAARLLISGGRLMGTVPHGNYADGGLHFHYFTPQALVDQARGAIPLSAGLMKMNPNRIVFWTPNIGEEIFETVDVRTIRTNYKCKT
tara:strand:- start:386 stop:1111 length:726 start_codon:yes stop_codon:yes gene_type:complete